MTAALRPVFGTALARSGAGLLSHMVSAHPEAMLARNPFLEAFKSLRDAVVTAASDPGLGGYAPADSPLADYYFSDEGTRLLDAVLAADLDLPIPAWEPLAERLAARATFEAADLAPHVGRLRAGSHRELIDAILAMIADVRGCPPGSWVGFQEPWVIDFFPALARAYPEARFVVLLRDPRAIVTSLKKIVATDPEQVVNVMSYARHWRKYAALAERYVSGGGPLSELLAGRTLVIRYEDLTRAPDEQLRMLCGFLDLPFDPAMTDPSSFHDFNTGRPFRGNSSFGEVGERIDAAAVERWRHNAPPGLVAAVEWLCGPDMALWGYEAPDEAQVRDEALAYLAEDAHGPSAWRSDFGDLQRDLGYELFRHAALSLPGALLDESTTRRSFLFTEVRDALRSTRAEPASAGR